MFRFVQNAMQRQFFFCPFFFIVIVTYLVNRTTYFSQHRKTISKSFLFSILVILVELIQILIPLRHGVCGISRRTSFKVQRLCAKRLSCLTHHCLKPSMCLLLKSMISSTTSLQTIIGTYMKSQQSVKFLQLIIIHTYLTLSRNLVGVFRSPPRRNSRLSFLTFHK